MGDDSPDLFNDELELVDDEEEPEDNDFGVPDDNDILEG